MTNGETERQIFWDIFDNKLIENGEPFSIIHEHNGQTVYWGSVNKDRAFVENALSLDFVCRSGYFRINFYMRDNLPIYNYLVSNIENIKKMIGVPINLLSGEKNTNTRRIAYIMNFDKNNRADYDRLIDEALPIIMKFIEVGRRYADRVFFDY